MAITKIERSESIRAQLELERSTWDAHWRELAENFMPRTPRFLTSDRNKGYKHHTGIYNSTPIIARRTLSAGMMAGMTSPERPWFRFTLPDPELNKYGPVRRWLSAVEQIIRDDMLRSNQYMILHRNYDYMATYGTGAFFMMQDAETRLRGYGIPIGSYYLGTNQRRKVDSCIREFSMSTRTLVEEFGIEKCSKAVRSEWDAGTLEVYHDVVHSVLPNADYREGVLGVDGFRWGGMFYEKEGHENEPLREEGFNEFPVISPRWTANAEDIYGESPGMLSLGDAKALQRMEKRFENAVELQIHPPMKAPYPMKNRPLSLLPGRINWYDPTKGNASFEPVLQVQTDLNAGLAAIQRLESRVNRNFFADIFLMLTLEQSSREMTATEIAAKREERLLAMGPLLGAVNDEQNDPLLTRWFAQELRDGNLPPAPDEIQGMPLKVEYISILAQAQKLVGVTSMDRFIGSINTLRITHPEVIDKVNADNAADKYAEFYGTDPEIVNDEETVDLIRARRAEELRKAQQRSDAMAAVEAAKMLSEADTSGQNALTDATGAAGPAPAAGPQPF